MPTALTFTSLQTDVRAYMERGTVNDPTVFSQLPRLINLAERRLARELKVQGFITAATSTLTIGTCVIDKPDRWRETISFNIGTGANSNKRVHLFPRSYEYLRYYWPDDSLTAQPEFYSDYDYRHWIVAPTPDLAYPFEVVYYELPALLDETSTTNWATEFAPNCLLYATLIEASVFLKDDERTKTWQDLYDRSISALTGEDLHKIMDRTVVRTGA